MRAATLLKPTVLSRNGRQRNAPLRSVATVAAVAATAAMPSSGETLQNRCALCGVARGLFRILPAFAVSRRAARRAGVQVCQNPVDRLGEIARGEDAVAAAGHRYGVGGKHQ